MMNALGWLMVALFTAINLFMSPLWLLVATISCAIDHEWRDWLRLWLGLSTGQYALPWWAWAAGV